MNTEHVTMFPILIRSSRHEAGELWRMALRGDGSARLELLRRIMPVHSAEPIRMVVPQVKAAA